MASPQVKPPSGAKSKGIRECVSDRFPDRDAAGVICPTSVVTAEAQPGDMGKIGDALQRKTPFLQPQVIARASRMMPLTDPHVTDPMLGEFIAEIGRGWQGFATAA